MTAEILYSNVNKLAEFKGHNVFYKITFQDPRDSYDLTEMPLNGVPVIIFCIENGQPDLSQSRLNKFKRRLASGLKTQIKAIEEM